MKKNVLNFYTLEELNQKETVNEIVDCYVHDDVHFKMLCANNISEAISGINVWEKSILNEYMTHLKGNTKFKFKND
jgi:hypothetical protein